VLSAAKAADLQRRRHVDRPADAGEPPRIGAQALRHVGSAQRARRRGVSWTLIRLVFMPLALPPPVFTIIASMFGSRFSRSVIFSVTRPPRRRTVPCAARRLTNRKSLSESGMNPLWHDAEHVQRRPQHRAEHAEHRQAVTEDEAETPRVAALQRVEAAVHEPGKAGLLMHDLQKAAAQHGL
jgi:hypothetical protein